MKIAILGASGVIGTWLTEKLLKNNLKPRLVIRQSPGIRLARYDQLDVVTVDFNDLSAVIKALVTYDVVVNCIVDKDNTKNAKQKIESNIKIAENIVSACQTNKVSKIIHLSSIVVLPPRITQEVIDNPFNYSSEKDWYTRAKIETEKIFRQVPSSIQTVILRPAIVYGPLIPWSIVAISKENNSVTILPNNTPSYCYAVHIDDLSKLIYKLIIDNSRLPLLIYGANPEKISWFDFYDTHVRSAGLKASIEIKPREQIVQYNMHLNKNMFIKKMAAWLILSPFTGYLAKIKFLNNLGFKLKEKLNLKLPSESATTKNEEEKIKLWPSKFEVDIYCSNGVLKREHNGELLGFKYHINLHEGCRNVSQWWNYQLENSFMEDELKSVIETSRFIK